MTEISANTVFKTPRLWHHVRTAPFLALVALEIDQLTKLVARDSLPTGDSIPLAAGFRLANVENPGIAFGVSAPSAVS